jgi:hypothetical protein
MDELAGEARRGAGVAIDQQDLAAPLAVGEGERLRGGAAGDARADDHHIILRARAVDLSHKNSSP